MLNWNKIIIIIVAFNFLTFLGIMIFASHYFNDLLFLTALIGIINSILTPKIWYKTWSEL